MQGAVAARVRVFAAPGELAVAAAAEVTRAAREAAAARGRFTLVLAGGSTPRATYEALARDETVRRSFPWDRTDVFWGDERHAPPDHVDSNFRMAREALLAHVPVAPSRVHRIAAERPDAREAAEAYEREMREVLGLGPGRSPAFDLVVLGLGADGHTASLFPGSTALFEPERLVLAPWVEHLAARRVTMTPRALLGAAAIVVLVAGAEKAGALRAALEGPTDLARHPAHCLRAAGARVTWFVDAAAAGFLSPASRR